MDDDLDAVAASLRTALKSVDHEVVDGTDVERNVLARLSNERGTRSRLLSRRYVPFVVAASTAAVICGSAAFLHQPWQVGPSPVGPARSQSVAINVGAWSPGDPGRQMRVSGTLAVSNDNCLYLRGDSGEAQDVVWPNGWSLTTDSNGAIALVDRSNNVVARVGDQIEAGGGVFDGDLTCSVGPTARAYAVESQISVVE